MSTAASASVPPLSPAPTTQSAAPVIMARLPQPFRMIDHALTDIIEGAVAIADLRRRQRRQHAAEAPQRTARPHFSCPVPASCASFALPTGGRLCVALAAPDAVATAAAAMDGEAATPAGKAPAAPQPPAAATPRAAPPAASTPRAATPPSAAAGKRAAKPAAAAAAAAPTNAAAAAAAAAVGDAAGQPAAPLSAPCEVLVMPTSDACTAGAPAPDSSRTIALAQASTAVAVATAQPSATTAAAAGDAAAVMLAAAGAGGALALLDGGSGAVLCEAASPLLAGDGRRQEGVARLLVAPPHSGGGSGGGAVACLLEGGGIVVHEWCEQQEEPRRVQLTAVLHIEPPAEQLAAGGSSGSAPDVDVCWAGDRALLVWWRGCSVLERHCWRRPAEAASEAGAQALPAARAASSWLLPDAVACACSLAPGGGAAAHLALGLASGAVVVFDERSGGFAGALPRLPSPATQLLLLLPRPSAAAAGDAAASVALAAATESGALFTIEIAPDKATSASGWRRVPAPLLLDVHRMWPLRREAGADADTDAGASDELLLLVAARAARAAVAVRGLPEWADTTSGAAEAGGTPDGGPARPRLLVVDARSGALAAELRAPATARLLPFSSSRLGPALEGATLVAAAAPLQEDKEAGAVAADKPQQLLVFDLASAGCRLADDSSSADEQPAACGQQHDAATRRAFELLDARLASATTARRQQKPGRSTTGGGGGGGGIDAALRALGRRLLAEDQAAGRAPLLLDAGLL